MNKRVILYMVAMLSLLAGILGPTGSGVRAADSRSFPETGKTVSGRFLQYWETHGGLAQQGFPISEQMQEKSSVDGNTYTVQYFERAVFEMHPENTPPYDVLLSLLGASSYNEKYGGNAPDQVPFPDNPLTFPETGKTIGGPFRTYWETHGGLAQQGFPISDEFQEADKDGNLRSVQYFERAVFEYHEEFAETENEVLLSLLGTFSYAQKYAQGGTPPQSGGVPPGGALTIVAIGDSLTEGQGDRPEGGGYPARLLASVRAIRPEAQMTNLGVSGYTSQQMVEEELPVALDASPQIALVWIGGNNLWNNGGPESEASDLNIFGADIDKTLSALTAKGAKTFISLVYDQTKSPYATSPNGAALDPEGVAHMSHLVTEFNKIITAKATQYGATTVDMYNTTIFTDPATLAEDDAHPNAAGYDLVAQIWFKAIMPVLK